MKNISFYVIVDSLFKFILFFIFNLIWCLYFIKTAWVAILLSIFLSIIFIFLINKLTTKKNNKKSNRLKKEQHIEDIKNTFIYMSNKEILSFFLSLAKTKHDCKMEDNYIEINTNSLPIILCPMFKSGNLSRDDVLDLYKKVKHKNLKRLIIVTNTVDTSIMSISKNFKFETHILDFKQTYSLLEEYEFYPEVLIKRQNSAKITLKQILSLSLNKKKTKGYLLSALFILFTSFFVRFKVYYLIFSSILLALAIFSYFNPSFNTHPKENLME